MYCYILTWPEIEMEEEKQWVSRLDTIVKMYALGDRYRLEGLKQEAAEQFKARLEACVEECFLEPIEELIAVIPLIYTTTPDTDRGLRDQAVEQGSLYWEVLWAQPVFKNRLTEIDDFINDVVTERGRP